MKFKLKVPEKVSRAAGKCVLAVKKRSPEILFCVGVVSFGAAIVSAVKASRECDDILADHEEELEEAKCEYVLPEDFEGFTEDEIEEVEESEEGDTEDQVYEISDELPMKTQKEINRAIRRVYKRTGIRFIRLYSKTAGFVIIALVCFGGVYKILSGRVAAGLATITGLNNYISMYEKRNVELNGKKSHEMCKYGYRDIERTYEDPDTGEMTTEVERVPAYTEEAEEVGGIDNETLDILQDGPSVLVFCKDETPEYKDVPALDIVLLQQAEADAERLWRTRGWVCENDTRAYLGMKPTAQGQRKVLYYKNFGNGNGDHGPKPCLNIDGAINVAAMNGKRKSWILETNYTEDIFEVEKEERFRKKKFEDDLRAKRLSEEAMY